MFLEKNKLKDDSGNDADWVRDLRIILIAAQKNYVLDAPLGDGPIAGVEKPLNFGIIKRVTLHHIYLQLAILRIEQINNSLLSSHKNLELCPTCYAIICFCKKAYRENPTCLHHITYLCRGQNA